jgi:Zn-dependent alcohol dehydrogenase
MRIRAAVVHEPGAHLVIQPLELEGPGPGEVLVKIAASSICATEFWAWNWPREKLPVVLGHEGAGAVTEVGKGVTSLKPGDHVVLCGAASCGHCRACAHDQTVMCETYRPYYYSGTLLEGRRRLSTPEGLQVNHFFLQSSFAEYAVVPVDVAIRIDPTMPLDVACVLGCGGVTGLGAVINRGKVRPGETVAIFGCGGVGVSAIMGARLAGAAAIIAVDIADNRLEQVWDFGATHTVNASQENAVEAIRRITVWGVDCSIAAVDAEKATLEAIECLAPGGRCVTVAPPANGVKLDMLAIIRQRALLGCSMGSGNARLDIPHYVQLYLQGNLPLDRMVTRRYNLIQINDALHDLRKGTIIKGVIVMD